MSVVIAVSDTANGKCWFEAQAVDYAYTLYNGGDAVELLYLKTRFQIACLVDQNRQLHKIIEKMLSYA